MGNVKKNRWVIAGKQTLICDDDHYCADPFELDGILFFEYYDYDKGVIAILNNGKPEVVLERPYHLSFPCVFKDNGEYYMLPETVNNNQLELYKAKNFPYNWELAKVINTGWYDDPIIYARPNEYHIFTTQGANNLKVFRADSILGDWREVYNDSSKQYRSAGNIFEANGKSIRPCQNCEGGYGNGLIFYELNGFEHREVKRFSIEGVGCHTFNSGYIDLRFPYEENLDTVRQTADLRRQIPYQN